MCDRWSERHLVNWSTAALLGDWVGSVFLFLQTGPCCDSALSDLAACAFLSRAVVKLGEQVSTRQMSVK